MAWLSRFANMIERMVTSLDGKHELEDEDAAGLWMSTADALKAAPDAQSTFAAPAVVALPAALPADLPPEPPGEARVVQVPVAPEAAPPEPSDEAPPFASPESAVDAAPEEEIVTQEAADTPVETVDQPAAIEHIAAPAESAEDMLSMFREKSGGSEYSGLTKEMEDITAQKLLDEARAVLDLLAPNRAPSEEDAIA